MLAHNFEIYPMPSNAKRPPAGIGSVATSRANLAFRFSEGKGAALLLIHGEGESMAAFASLFGAPIADAHRMLAIDLPGHGASSEAYDPQTACTVEGYADVALECLERLGIDYALVVDRSAGGRIGLELMSIFPGMLGLAIVGGSTDAADVVNTLIPVHVVAEASEVALAAAVKGLAAREAQMAQNASSLWYGG